MNNPFQLFQAMRNPQQFLQQMAGNSQAMSNPILKNAMDMAIEQPRPTGRTRIPLQPSGFLTLGCIGTAI